MSSNFIAIPDVFAANLGHVPMLPKLSKRPGALGFNPRDQSVARLAVASDEQEPVLPDYGKNDPSPAAQRAWNVYYSKVAGYNARARFNLPAGTIVFMIACPDGRWDSCILLSPTHGYFRCDPRQFARLVGAWKE